MAKLTGYVGLHKFCVSWKSAKVEKRRAELIQTSSQALGELQKHSMGPLITP
jgi:hypothetical protein